jgi:hypothetical protein
MAKWRHFAAQEHPRVIRDLALPAATAQHGLARCPRHDVPLGAVTHMCPRCHGAAWAEVGRRYAAQHNAATSGREEVTVSDSEVVEQEAALVRYEPPASPALPGLFGSDDPRLVVGRVVDVADELARIVREKKLAVRISGKEHVLVEGWTLLGTLVGVFPVLEWSRPVDGGWEARVVARTLDGRAVRRCRV